MEDEILEQETEATPDLEWDFSVPEEKPDPVAELKAELASMRQLLETPKETSYTDELKQEIKESLKGELSPLLESIRRPQEVDAIVNTVCNGLDQGAEQAVRGYINKMGYTSDVLAHIRQNDKDTLNILRLAAEGAAKKKTSAPRSEAIGETEGTTAPEDREYITSWAHTISNQLGIPYNDALKKVEKEYREARNA
jgi:DNA-binding protein YbaB